MKRSDDDVSRGQRIKKARKAKSLSQEQLAVRIGVTRSSIGQWEIGANSPNYENINKVAQALRVSREFLAFGGRVTDVEEPLSEIESGEDEVRRFRISDLMALAESHANYNGVVRCHACDTPIDVHAHVFCFSGTATSLT
ncbi:helix-turn-helix transcriptional regulator [uncultured Tateyamaria sp.]|uniref:helix-turn-helix domain-containing protein n=1 Tax=uncultured Tateyamaria sp. TaxID=455651 RepID=UPI002613140A|nr:helix-turn-helix transcriptional regulator [uncultured Tateyamaria sp.]